MGSHLIELRNIAIRSNANATKKLSEIFRQAREQSFYEDGHDPYGGGWNTINGLAIPEPQKIDLQSKRIRCERCWGEGNYFSEDRHGQIQRIPCRSCKGSGWKDANTRQRSKNGSFANLDAARAFAEEHAEKWGPALAIRYRDNGKNRWAIFGRAAS